MENSRSIRMILEKPMFTFNISIFSFSYMICRFHHNEKNTLFQLIKDKKIREGSRRTNYGRFKDMELRSINDQWC
jgi:catabolite regulation protein CreA